MIVRESATFSPNAQRKQATRIGAERSSGRLLALCVQVIWALAGAARSDYPFGTSSDDSAPAIGTRRLEIEHIITEARRLIRL